MGQGPDDVFPASLSYVVAEEDHPDDERQNDNDGYRSRFKVPSETRLPADHGVEQHNRAACGTAGDE